MKPKIKNTQYPGIPENFPSVSIMIPFEPMMNTTTGLHFKLAAAAAKEEKKLMQNYPENEALPVINKLHDLIRNLECNPRHMSVGIFVSPHASKVYYFNYSEPEIKNDNRA
jgi:hypothetical protein